MEGTEPLELDGRSVQSPTLSGLPPVAPLGLEPRTNGLGVRCSNQLSYGAVAGPTLPEPAGLGGGKRSANRDRPARRGLLSGA